MYEEYEEYEEGEPIEERICLACGVGGCECDSGCLNCGSTDPDHSCLD